uniref:Uncharacterized protein n=1 Tax=Vespula pensylvanica TaxID=30213 RepID=A0A834NRC9_VESPE|nr:hypothetical protein H0235_011151 [Vespula pensylvanica]
MKAKKVGFTRNSCKEDGRDFVNRVTGVGSRVKCHRYPTHPLLVCPRERGEGGGRVEVEDSRNSSGGGGGGGGGDGGGGGGDGGGGGGGGGGGSDSGGGCVDGGRGGRRN